MPRYMVPALIGVWAESPEDAVEDARESVSATHYGETPVYIDQSRTVEVDPDAETNAT